MDQSQAVKYDGIRGNGGKAILLISSELDLIVFFNTTPNQISMVLYQTEYPLRY